MIKKFKELVKPETGKELVKPETGNEDTEKAYVKLTVTDEGKYSCETLALEQTLLIYSNGDSKGTNNCTIKAEQSYIGGVGNALWTSRRCKRIVVTFNNKDNWQRYDFNDDKKVNIQDLILAGDHVGKTKPADEKSDAYKLFVQVDVDGDGTVTKEGRFGQDRCLFW